MLYSQAQAGSQINDVKSNNNMEKFKPNTTDTKGNVRLPSLVKQFSEREAAAVPNIDASLKGTRKGTACKPFNFENMQVWEQARRLGMTLVGKVRCTYADIAVPTTDGSLTRIFSLQAKAFDGDYIIEDCGASECSSDLTTAVFGAPAPCDTRDFYDGAKPHVGRLSDEAFAYVSQHCNLTTPYVIYFPKRLTWHFLPEKCKGIEANTKSGKSGKWFLPLLAGAVSFLID